jgi:hypothetical protein
VKTQYVVAGAVVVIIAAAAGAYVYLQHVPATKPAVTAPAPAAPAPTAPPAVQAPPAAPAPAAAPTDCILPGPPPVPPDGATSTDAEMKLGHDVIQHFVLQLEAYQACRNAMIDHAPAGTTQERKQIWVQGGNAAVDEAHDLADAFSIQLKIYKARKK